MIRGGRIVYIDSETLLQFPQFLESEKTKVTTSGSLVKITANNFSVLPLIKLLHQLKQHSELSFTHLFTKSRIRMKASFLNHLSFCLANGFLKKRMPSYKSQGVYYSLTEKGGVFLSLFSKT